MSNESTVIYAYGFVRAGFDVSRAPAGIDDAPVIVCADAASSFAGLASRLPGDVYNARQIEERSAELAWLSPRAQAHDLVLTWAHDHGGGGGVLPLPMFSLWASEASLREALVSRRDELAATFARVAEADEFGLRVHRKGAVMMESVGRIDPVIRQLEDQAAAASPGQRYLLERKLADEKRAAARSASQRLAREVYERLEQVSRQAVFRPLAPTAASSPDMTLVLNGAFLVDRARADEFRATVARQMQEHESLGLAFDFTGPWPPYNFVGGDGSRRGAAEGGSADS